jgi:DNA-binding IclR family transcriptional regulator
VEIPVPGEGAQVDDHTVTGRVLAVLDAVAAHDGPMSLAELTRAVAIPKPTVRRIATDLCSRRMLQRCADGGYLLGAHMLELGMRAASQLGLRQAATPYLQELLARTGEIAWIGALSGTSVTLVDSAYGANRAADVRRRSWPMDMYSPAFQATAGGRVLLASEPELVESLRVRPIPALTPHTTTSWSRLTTTLEAVRDTGVATEHQECALGFSCVATGLHDPNGHLIGILGVTGHTTNLSVQRLTRPLLNAARDITRTLTETG